MKILLLGEDRLRLEGVAGPMTIEAESPETTYSPFHMLASALATCVYSVLHSWASNSKLSADDLVIEVGWSFTEHPYRIGAMDMDLIWPSLPENRRSAAERASHLCPVHQTLQHQTPVETRVKAS